MTALEGWLGQLLVLTLPPLPGRHPLYRPLFIAGLVGLGLAIGWLPITVTVLLLAGSVFLVALLRAPVAGLYFLILLIPFSSLLRFSFGSFNAGAMELVLALGLLAWVLQIWTGQSRLDTRPAYLLGPFLIFLGSVSFSWLTAVSIGASLVETVKWLEMLALYLFVVSVLSGRGLTAAPAGSFTAIKWVVIALLLAGTAQAVLGLYQFIFKVGPEGFLLFGGRFLRAYGTFAQPNPYGGYLGLGLPLALALTLWALTSLEFANKPKNREFKLKILVLLLSSLGLGLLLAALFASQSRGAWLAFGLAAIATIVAGSRRPGLLLTVGIAVVAAVGLAGAFDWTAVYQKSDTLNTPGAVIVQRVIDAATIAAITDIATVEVTDANFSTLERLAHWQAARAMWRDNLWLGTGFGNYALVYPAYAVGRWLDPLGHAHNYLLNIGAEAGLIGIIGYLFLWGLALTLAWKAARFSQGFHRAVAAGSLGILVHLHIHNLVDNLYVQGMYLHVAVILALVSLIYHFHGCQLQGGGNFSSA